MKNFYECKTEDEKQKLRDEMLEHMYYQVIATRSEVSEIRERVKRIEQKLVYVGATQEERKYINVDGTLNLEAVNDTCDNILTLFGDEYITSSPNGIRVDEVNDNGKDER